MHYLEFLCFLYDSTNVGNLISGSSAFSKSSMYILKLSVHILCRATLKHFEHYLASMWHECNVLYFEHPFALSSVGLEWKLIFSSPVVTAAFFQICGHIECNTLTTSSFEILNSSTGIPSAPLALSVVTLPAHLISYSRISGSRWVITPLWLSGSLRTLFVLFFCVFLPFFLISSASGPIKNP